MIEALRESLNDIRMRLRLLFTRGRLTFVYPNGSGETQRLQATGLAGETVDQFDHAEAYGHASKPLPGAECFMGAVLGQRNQLVALIINDPRGRPDNLKDGEVAIWSAYGQRILLRKDGGITIDVPKADLTINCPHANINVTGDAIVKAGEVARFEGREVEIHAKEKLSVDCGGFGYVQTPTHRKDYVINSTGESFVLNPDEVPD